MITTTLTTPDALRVLAPAWDELADAADATPFARPAWCLPWWAQLGRGRLHVVTVTEGRELVAVAPLHERRFGPLRVRRFLGHGLGAVSEAVVAPGRHDAAEALWGHAMAGVGTVLQLTEFRDGGGGFDQLAASAPTTATPHEVCPVVDLHADYFARRSGSFRQRLRKADRRADAAGGIAFEVVTAPGRLDEVLPEVARVFDAAERANPRLHLFEPRWAPFTRALLHEMARCRQLRLVVGRVAGEPAIAWILFATGRRWSYWAGRFDPVHKPLSLGHLMLRAVVEDALAVGGVDTLDLLIGENDYKLRWSTGSYRTLAVTAAGNPRVHQAGRAALAGVEEVHARRRRRHAGAAAKAAGPTTARATATT